MSFTFVHASDLHLDSPLRGLEKYEGAPAAELRGATRQAFVNLVTWCLENQVAFLLLAGDIYDGDWKDYNTGLFFQHQLARLRDAKIAVYIVHGNHDAENRMTRSLRSLRDLGNVHIFSARKAETKTIEELNVAIHGRSYDDPETSEDLTLEYPKPAGGAFNIGLLHTSADGRSAEHKKYAPCTLQGLIDKGYDYWALGHIHKREVLRTEPYIVFPGNLQGRHIREAGAKGATIVTVRNGRVASVEHRDFDVIRWQLCEVSVDSARTPSQVIDLVAARLAALRADAKSMPLAVRLRLCGATEAHAGLVASSEHWISEIRGQGNNQRDIWIEKVLIETRASIDLNALRLQANPIGELLRTIDSVRHDETALLSLAGVLKPLQSKLPFDPLGGGDLLQFDSPEAMRRLLDEVEQLLVPALLEEEAA